MVSRSAPGWLTLEIGGPGFLHLQAVTSPETFRLQVCQTPPELRLSVFASGLSQAGAFRRLFWIFFPVQVFVLQENLAVIRV
jgi:hypothetical protein